MCKPASGIFVKGHKAYWSKYSDSHEKIIEEHKLNADGVKGPNIVRFEITPPDGDISEPLKDWKYNVDQDTLPSWYDKDEAEKSARLMLEDWAKQKIVDDRRDKLLDGEYFILSTGTVTDNRGTVNDNSGTVTDNRGTVNCNRGTVNDNSGTVNYNSGTVTDNRGTVNYNFGTVKVNRGTVITYIKADMGMMKSASAVLVDRSVNPPVCYVGIQK